MSLFLASLNSGSNGNCYYVGNEEEAVFIDAGLSVRETERRMEKLGLSMSRVKAIFITHEHADHVTGMVGLSRKFDLPVYITPRTLKGNPMPLEPERTRTFTADEVVQIGGLCITPFIKYHDGRDPHSFRISGNGVEIGVFTDIGKPCDRLTEHFSLCHAVILESNYDANMLERGRYPWPLKQRIRGGLGHLSNEQALEVFRNYRGDHLKLLMLGHLSKQNNRPELVESLFQPHAGETEIVVISRYHASALYRVEAGEVFGPKAPKKALIAVAHAPVQLNLF
jgi:phosphoribosyl 1,2-cyclic phosphodiesterase